MINVQSIRIEGNGQVVEYIEHLTLFAAHMKRHTLRVTVHNDHYAAQSYGTVERWDGKKWAEVATTRTLTMPLGICYIFGKTAAYDAKLEAFRPDRDRLVVLAEEVL